MRARMVLRCLPAVGEGFFDALVPQRLVSVDAAGVDPPEDFDAVPGAAGDFGGRDAGVEREGDAAMAQVVGASGERGCLLGLGERGGAGFVPDAAVDVAAEDAALAARAPGHLEQPPVGGGTEAFDVVTQDSDEDVPADSWRRCLLPLRGRPGTHGR